MVQPGNAHALCASTRLANLNISSNTPACPAADSLGELFGMVALAPLVARSTSRIETMLVGTTLVLFVNEMITRMAKQAIALLVERPRAMRIAQIVAGTPFFGLRILLDVVRLPWVPPGRTNTLSHSASPQTISREEIGRVRITELCD